MLSEFLNNNGFTTLRYDKRGVSESCGDYNESGLTEFIDDASKALSYLKSNEFITPKKIVVIGHSEGAFITPAIIYQENHYDASILLCGAAAHGKQLISRPGEKIALEIQNWPGILGKIFRLFKAEKIFKRFWDYTLVKSLSSNNAMIRLFGLIKFNAKWLRELYDFDVRKHLASIDVPVLVIGGEKDIQADASEVASICKLIPGETKGKIIPNMNHVLCYSEKNHKMLTCMYEYISSSAQGIHNELKSSILDWLYSSVVSKPNLSSKI